MSFDRERMAEKVSLQGEDGSAGLFEEDERDEQRLTLGRSDRTLRVL